ncbi:MAG: glutamyl-tRNA reductase [Chloroflexi bacterium]|nr:glutamyl-tRNA reductase [Chloroflexota bacterium]
MRILALGLSHHTAPVALRDRVAVPTAQMPEYLHSLKDCVGKGVVLSTCNRWEAYTLAPTARGGIAALTQFLATYHGVDMQEVGPHLYALNHRQAVRHLFRVACGLDSQILGESQVLGQVREAYAASARAGMDGGTLARLFHQALRVGKRARRETEIGWHALSVSRAAVELARRTLGDLSSCQVVVIGAGDAGRLAAQALRDAGATSLTVANRTLARAEELAAELGGRAAPLEDLPRLLEEADIAISATGSPGFLLTPALLASARAASTRPLFLLDIAVPRDVDPAVADLPDVHLVDIDGLDAVAESNRRQRQSEARKVEGMVKEETESFLAWLRSLEVVPTVAALHQRAEALRSQELSRANRRLPDLSQEERATLEAFSKALVKKLLHRPTTTLKAKGDPNLTQAAREMYGLD